eukprot:CCRYP_014362-RC/>CCRYP_014362-RC protein AED:0.49 eAED:0.49 QI:0/-1/0/1/-1/0/1/0/16
MLPDPYRSLCLWMTWG